MFAISTKQREEIMGFWIKFKFLIYTLIAIVCLILLILILKYIKSKSSDSERKKGLRISKAKEFVSKARNKGHSNEKIIEMFKKKEKEKRSYK